MWWYLQPVLDAHDRDAPVAVVRRLIPKHIVDLCPHFWRHRQRRRLTLPRPKQVSKHAHKPTCKRTDTGFGGAGAMSMNDDIVKQPGEERKQKKNKKFGFSWHARIVCRLPDPSSGGLHQQHSQSSVFVALLYKESYCKLHETNN